MTTGAKAPFFVKKNLPEGRQFKEKCQGGDYTKGDDLFWWINTASPLNPLERDVIIQFFHWLCDLLGDWLCF